MSKFRDEVWHILNDPEDDRYGLFLGFITILIFLSVGLLLYETFVLPTIDPGQIKARAELLQITDRLILAVFLVEYIGQN